MGKHELLDKEKFQSALFYTRCGLWLILLWFCAQESDKSVNTLQEDEDVNMKEYSDYLTLEESIMKGMGLWPATANTQET